MTVILTLLYDLGYYADPEMECQAYHVCLQVQMYDH